MYFVSTYAGSNWLNKIDGNNVVTEFLINIGSAAQVGVQHNQIFITDATGSSVTVVMGTTTYTVVYTVSVSTAPGKILPMVIGNIYITHTDSVEVIEPAVTITGSEDYNFIQRDTTYNPILVKHTHLYFPNTSQLRNAFSLNMVDSGGDSWSLLMPMRQYSSGAQPNQQVQECFAYNEILFDGRQSLTFTINANDRMFLEFYYVQASIPDLLRKKMLSDTGLYWNKKFTT